MFESNNKAIVLNILYIPHNKKKNKKYIHFKA